VSDYNVLRCDLPEGLFQLSWPNGDISAESFELFQQLSEIQLKTLARKIKKQGVPPCGIDPFSVSGIPQVPTGCSDIIHAAAEIAGLRKDAERYRWLRHGDNDDCVIMRNTNENFLLRNEHLDMAIDTNIRADAALAKE
jgi:hypothetical protein